MLKFNVDWAAREKLRPAGIGGLLHNSEGIVLALSLKHVGCMKSNDVEVIAILDAIQIFTSIFFSFKISG